MHIEQYLRRRQKEGAAASLFGGPALFLLAIAALYLENLLLLKLRVEPFRLRGGILLGLFLIFS